MRVSESGLLQTHPLRRSARTSRNQSLRSAPSPASPDARACGLHHLSQSSRCTGIHQVKSKDGPTMACDAVRAIWRSRAAPVSLARCVVVKSSGPGAIRRQRHGQVSGAGSALCTRLLLSSRQRLFVRASERRGCKVGILPPFCVACAFG